MYTTNGNTDSSAILTEPATLINNNHVPLDDLPQPLSDSDLYVPPMFAV